MDGLSVASSLAGLLEAGAVMSSVLIRFAKRTKNAPHAAKQLISEVESLKAVHHHLDAYLSLTTCINSPGASLITVADIQLTLSEYMRVFSQLEHKLGTCQNDEEWKIFDRLNWVLTESSINSLLERLQRTRNNLMLLLTILNRYVSIA